MIEENLNFWQGIIGFMLSIFSSFLHCVVTVLNPASLEASYSMGAQKLGNHLSSQSVQHLAKWTDIRTFFSLSIIEFSWNIQTNLNTYTMKTRPQNRKENVQFLITFESLEGVPEYKTLHPKASDSIFGVVTVYHWHFTWIHSCNSHHKPSEMNIIPPLSEEKAEVHCVEVSSIVITSASFEARKPGALVVWPWANVCIKYTILCRAVYQYLLKLQMHMLFMPTIPPYIEGRVNFMDL